MRAAFFVHFEVFVFLGVPEGVLSVSNGRYARGSFEDIFARVFISLSLSFLFFTPLR